MQGDARIEKKKKPSDLEQGNVIQAGYNNFFHLVNGCRTPLGMETKFCHAPVLFYKIQFTVVLQVEVAEMTMGLNEFLKL
jgi:hypothetical protein